MITLPRMWTVTTNAPLVLASAYALLCLNRVSKLRSAVARHQSRITRAERAAVFTRPMALIAFVGTVLSYAANTTEHISKSMATTALARQDQSDYIKWQVWYAVVTAPLELKRAHVLAQGVNDRDDQPGPDCSSKSQAGREGLMTDMHVPDVFRIDLLRADASCARRVHDEITVVHDIATIHHFPFDFLDPQIAAVEDLCFGAHDYDGCVIAARNAGPAGRRELLLIRKHSRDPRLRHAIDLGLAT